MALRPPSNILGAVCVFAGCGTASAGFFIGVFVSVYLGAVYQGNVLTKSLRTEVALLPTNN